VLGLVALLPLAVVAHVLFVGDRPLDSKMTMSCNAFTGKTYRRAFYDGWRLASDTRACDHCSGQVELGLPRQSCAKYAVSFIYCPSSSLVVSSHESSEGDRLTDFCI
jgi:hypothetical protein